MAEEKQAKESIVIALPEPEFGTWIIDSALKIPQMQNDTEALEFETPMIGNTRIVAVVSGFGETPASRIDSKQEAINRLIVQYSQIRKEKPEMQVSERMKEALNEVNAELTEKEVEASIVFALLEQNQDSGQYNIEFIIQGSCQAFIMDKDGDLTPIATTPTDKLGTENINWARQVRPLQSGDRILLMSQQVDKHYYEEIGDALSSYSGDPETVSRVQNGLARIFTESKPVEETMSVAVFTIPGAELYITPEE